MVALQIAAARKRYRRPFILHNQIIAACAMDITAQGSGGVAIIFGNQFIAIIQERGDGRPRCHLPQPAQGVIGQPDTASRAGRAHKTVFNIIDIAGRPQTIGRAGQIAIGIIAEARTARRAILIEAVDGIAPHKAGQPACFTCIAIRRVAPRARGDLADGVVGEAGGQLRGYCTCHRNSG